MSQARSLPRFTDPEAFDAWETGQPDRWELHDGVPVAMAPEQADHVILKAQCWLALRNALRAKHLPCTALIDGMAVPGPGARRFKPDVIVRCGAPLPGDTQIVHEPVILVEVLSPSTRVIDQDIKLSSYFTLPSVEHYLLVSSTHQLIVSHTRQADGQLLTGLHHRGALNLEHPGIAIDVDEIYDGTSIAGVVR